MPDPAEQHKIDELTSDYANNTAIQATVWDLKLLFGEYSQFLQGIEWHTAITMPWAQAKLLAFYLQVNIAIHELRHGFVRIPESMLPPPLPPIAEEQSADKMERAQYELIKALRDRFLSEQKNA